MQSTVYGSFQNAVGANRVRIPAKYRSFLGDDVIATIGSDGCFLLMPACNKDVVLKNYVGVDDPYMSQYKDVARVVNRLTANIELDSQGRITVDDKLKKMCKGLANTEAIVFCGMGNYIEAWPKELYDARFEDDGNDVDEFDSLIANLKAQLAK